MMHITSGNPINIKRQKSMEIQATKLYKKYRIFLNLPQFSGIPTEIG
jgi:hypothetical protein